MCATTNNTAAIAIPLERDLQEFFIDRQARNLTPSTIYWYERSLGYFQFYLASQGVQTVADVDPGMVRRFILYLQERGHNDGGVANIFGAVKAFLRWYEEEYAPDGWKNPLRKVKTPKRSQEPLEPLELDDFQAMLRQCPSRAFTGDRDRAMLLLLLDTGVRQQELTDLRVGDVDLTTGSVLVRQGKGRKPRTVFIGAKTRRALARYYRHRETLADAEPLWLTTTGTGLTVGGIREIVRRRAKQAGISMPGLHTFRRAFAINCLRSGMDLVSLQRLLGHSSLQIINRYLYFVDDDLRRAHSQHGVVDSLL